VLQDAGLPRVERARPAAAQAPARPRGVRRRARALLGPCGGPRAGALGRAQQAELGRAVAGEQRVAAEEARARAAHHVGVAGEPAAARAGAQRAARRAASARPAQAAALPAPAGPGCPRRCEARAGRRPALRAGPHRELACRSSTMVSGSAGGSASRHSHRREHQEGPSPLGSTRPGRWCRPTTTRSACSSVRPSSRMWSARAAARRRQRGCQGARARARARRAEPGRPPAAPATGAGRAHLGLCACAGAPPAGAGSPGPRGRHPNRCGQRAHRAARRPGPRARSRQPGRGPRPAAAQALALQLQVSRSGWRRTRPAHTRPTHTFKQSLGTQSGPGWSRQAHLRAVRLPYSGICCTRRRRGRWLGADASAHPRRVRSLAWLHSGLLEPVRALEMGSPSNDCQPTSAFHDAKRHSSGWRIPRRSTREQGGAIKRTQAALVSQPEVLRLQQPSPAGLALDRTRCMAWAPGDGVAEPR